MDMFTLLSAKSLVFEKSDDSFSDRLNYRYTVGLLLLGAVILTTKQYGSEAINCWVPAHFKPSYEHYVTQICWVQNTYYIPANKSIPHLEEEREGNQIKYYQWVTFVLLFQAFMFYIPRIFWTTFSARCGFFIGDLIETADKYRTCENPQQRLSYMNYLVKNIDQLVDDKRRRDRRVSKHYFLTFLRKTCPCTGLYMGNYIVCLYIVTKIIYILNTIAQIHFTGSFLGESFWTFGYFLITELITGRGWKIGNSKYFPKVTLCDFKIREIGNPNQSHRYTVQCVLPINLFNQQIFTIVWFWYIIVLAWNVYNLLNWIKKICPLNAKLFIEQRTKLFNENVKYINQRKRLDSRFNHFVDFYLEQDGIFLLRMVGQNAGDYVATDLIHYLWCEHNSKYGMKFLNEPHIGPNSAPLEPLLKSTRKNVFFSSDLKEENEQTSSKDDFAI